jgi:hypothetical protein
MALPCDGGARRQVLVHQIQCVLLDAVLKTTARRHKDGLIEAATMPQGLRKLVERPGLQQDW